MKKAAVSLMMSILDQASPSDDLADARRLRCAVAAFSKGSALPAKGNITLRLEGSSQNGAQFWSGAPLKFALDDRGTVVFAAEDIFALVDAALDQNAEPARYRIDFKGGKGKKVAEATLDCVHELTGGSS